MKITDVKSHLLMPMEGHAWLFVQVLTDEGTYGIGECTNYGTNPALVTGIESIIRPLIIGEDPFKIEEIWQRIFHSYSSSNSRGFISQLISGVDIALWDIKGKVLGVPIFELLGGKVRDSVPLYTHVQDQTPTQSGFLIDGIPQSITPSIDDMVEAAKLTMKDGFEAIKTDPFPHDYKLESPEYPGTNSLEHLNDNSLRKSIDWMEALRETVGNDFEVLVDAHGRFDVASAIRAANSISHLNLVWFEEPCHAANHQALEQVRNNTDVSLCVGERHFTRWDYNTILENGLVDYVMPDVAWCGGISELRRIASMAEVYYTRVSPHDALGPIAIAAGFQACMAIPNLYRQECIHTWFTVFDKIITPALDVRGGSMYPNYKPGIGFDLKWDEIEKYRVDPEDPLTRRRWYVGSKNNTKIIE